MIYDYEYDLLVELYIPKSVFRILCSVWSNLRDKIVYISIKIYEKEILTDGGVRKFIDWIE